MRLGTGRDEPQKSRRAITIARELTGAVIVRQDWLATCSGTSIVHQSLTLVHFPPSGLPWARASQYKARRLRLSTPATVIDDKGPEQCRLAETCLHIPLQTAKRCRTKQGIALVEDDKIGLLVELQSDRYLAATVIEGANDTSLASRCTHAHISRAVVHDRSRITSCVPRPSVSSPLR